MKTKILRTRGSVGVAVAVVLALSAMLPAGVMAGHQSFQNGTSPGGVTLRSVGGVGVASCDEDPPLSLVFECGTNSFGGAAFNVSHLNDPLGDNNPNTIRGDCTVEKLNTLPGFDITETGKVEFLCAANRDDDQVHTNVDTSDDQDVSTPDHKSDPDYDDMGWNGLIPEGTLNGASTPLTDICFAHDADTQATGTLAPETDPHDWDTIVVFIGGEYSADPVEVENYVGTVEITLNFIADGDDCEEDTFGVSAAPAANCVRNRGVSDPGHPVDSGCGGTTNATYGGTQEPLAGGISCGDGDTIRVDGEAVGVDVTFTFECGGVIATCEAPADTDSDPTEWVCTDSQTAGFTDTMGTCTADVDESTVDGDPDDPGDTDAEHYSMVCKSVPA